MVRQAVLEDAEQLWLLNEQFNGSGNTSLESIQDSLLHNRQEVVVVAEQEGGLAGFVCVQIKRSFCYRECFGEITEVFVTERCRRRKLASRMIAFAEQICADRYAVDHFVLQTGKENLPGQALYRSLGYREEEELLMEKVL